MKNTNLQVSHNLSETGGGMRLGSSPALKKKQNRE
jgi:hypothetical protein